MTDIEVTELREALEASFSLLTKKEVVVLRRRYGLDGYSPPLLEIARELKCSRSYARGLEARALKKLSSAKELSVFKE